MHQHVVRIVLMLLWIASLAVPASYADDWPMLGRNGTRNSVSNAEGAPTYWQQERQTHEGNLVRPQGGVLWSAPLGTETFSTPVVSAGLLWIGTNDAPANSRESRQSVLKCFRVSDGKLVYKLLSPSLPNWWQDSGYGGLGSSPLIEGDRLWITTNRAELICLDIGPLIRSEGEPRELWRVNLVDRFDIHLYMPLMGPPRPCSLGPSWNGRIYVTLANGLNANNGFNVEKPESPSLVCLDKNTGATLWTDNSPGNNILAVQAASPTIADIGGAVQVIVPQSDGWVRAFDPESGTVLWEFDVNFKSSVFKFNAGGNRCAFYGNAVIYEGLVYVASGQEPEQGEGPGRVVCIDPMRRGDISSELAVDAQGKVTPKRRVQALDSAAGEKAIPNPNSGLVWDFTSCGEEFEDTMHRSLSSMAIAQGLVIACDFSGMVHCIDAHTGHRYWGHDVLSTIWSTPLIVGDKVYVGDENGNLSIFHLGADIGNAEPLERVAHRNGIFASPIYVDGVLFVPTRQDLLAVESKLSKAWSESESHWPQWRGVDRKNIAAETGLLSQWPPEGPPLVWKVEQLGDGIASLAAARGVLFTTTTYHDTEYAVAIDSRSGERLWITKLDAAVQEHILMRWFGQRTPTVDENSVYFFSNAGTLVCLHRITGKENWRVSYPYEFGTTRENWGYCDRPLIDGNKVICNTGGTKATIAALDKRTGKAIWSNLLETPEPAGYGGSLVIDTDGLKQYVLVLKNGVAAFAAEDGRFLWRYNGVSTPVGNSYTPLAVDHGLLCLNGYQAGIARLRLERNGDRVTASELYVVPHVFDPFEDSTAIVNNHLFAFRSRGVPICIDIQDGSQRWTNRASVLGKAAAIFADGHAYALYEHGVTVLMEANVNGHVEKSRFSLPNSRKALGATFPVIANGYLYMRDNDRLYCYDVKQHDNGYQPSAPRSLNWTPPRRMDQGTGDKAQNVLRAIYVPTPTDVVVRMLQEAKLTKDDLVYDLGSGDGRVIIAAAKSVGCKAVGIELDPKLVAMSRDRAKEAMVDELVTIKEQDFYTADFSDATVVVTYLPEPIMAQLKPAFQKLRPGTRIVSHQFSIPGFPPDRTVNITSQETGSMHTIRVWTTQVGKP